MKNPFKMTEKIHRNAPGYTWVGAILAATLIVGWVRIVILVWQKALE